MDDVASRPDPVPTVSDEVSLASRFAPDEPEEHEPEVHNPEVHDEVPAVQASANTEPDVSEGEGGAQAQQSSGNPWQSVVSAARMEQEESGPASFVAENGSDRDAADPVEAVEHAGSAEPEVHQPDVVEPEVHGTRVGETEVATPEPAEVERHEPEHVEASIDEQRGETHVHDATETEVHTTEPVAAESDLSEPAASEPVTPAWGEPTEAVEWHAPSAPVPADFSSNGDGIPPAPSDDARYDDIWSAAFAPPAPEPTHENGEQPSAPVEASQADAEPEPANVVGAAQEAEAPANEASPDDQPAPPEDRMSADDEMWSLRARLADAAARKKLPHRSD
jgi:hypothetical protein